MTTGHDGAICTLQDLKCATVLAETREAEMPVSGDHLTRTHHGITGHAVTGVRGQLWR